MKISQIHTEHYRIPLPIVLSDSTHGDISHFGLIVTSIETEGGLEGMGYTYCGGDIGGSAILAFVRDDLAPILIGEEADRIERLWERMWWHVHFVGRGGAASFALAALDIALWDLRGKASGEPWWRLLGGHDPKVPVYAGGIDLQFSLDALLEQADGFQAQGFRAIKMKVGRDQLSEDLERVAAMRNHLGADFPLMADANMRWRVDEAIRAARGMAEYNLFWLEEPTIPDDVAGHARIAREGGLPIATGENFHTVYEFQQMIAHGAISFPEPDVATMGGVTPWLKVAHLAETCNLPVTTHGVHDLQVHLLAAVPNSSYLEAHGFGLDQFIRHPLQIEEGAAIAPDRAGHGVEFDCDALQEHKV
ncbi:MAG: mandelate racemase/muconate lactonizing enzyme family protein [Caldilineaceae bacterium SB0675_bin_29]|uniref:Mandelate racemase/muconate lactonizing enzyme family protein n=1 Tax=Caldilineaceae bacterium SB0675_bin_29 TaxID=2605266 RepID=A0A6B1GBY1_9CHLR|nr:mandelate racemase/muconate lactonizing enzyme family protein [Caldilineaceae bacterium SB0675_bin_29]